MKKLIVLTALTSAAFAAYGPAPKAAVHASNWNLGVGYGQMFGMKKTLLDNNVYAKLDKPSLIELDLFNKNGFGMVYMMSANKKDIITSAPLDGEYSFKGYFMGYQRAISENMHWRLLAGMSDQKFVDGSSGDIYESGNEFAYSGSLDYHMHISDDTCGFVEAGYLGQKEFNYSSSATNKVSGSGFYLKLGAKIAL